MAYRLGVDIGGTFTDFALLEGSTGRLRHYKSPTTPADPAEGVISGLRDFLEQTQVDPGEIEYFVHGTTLGLNTVIQRSGASVGFFTTHGFHDVLEVQRMRLADPLNFASTRPAPLVPRWQVFEIHERILTDGSVDVPLDRESVVRAFRAAAALGLDAIVVCLLNSYRNPEHERTVRSIGAEVAPDMYVCCSYEVWPQIREYERSIVAVINAYVRPRLAGYLDTLARRLREIGVPVEPYVTRSNGGVMTARSAHDMPVQTLLSGPASGVIGAVHAARLAGVTDFLTLDMGGTSADIAVVRNGEPRYSRDEHVGDFPVIMPSVGVSSIGAGGGSIAWIDRSGLLKVGPHSAGADPGPACYGRGGTQPTLTDAFLLNGFIDPHNFLGGRIRLDEECARSAIRPLAERLDLSIEAAAEAIVEVSTANMYAEFSQVMARHGLDPRDFSLVAFGGAGPIQACLLAAEFHIPRVLVPPSPGTLCALGALTGDIRNDYVRTVNTRLVAGAVARLRPLVADLRQQAETWLATEGPAVAEHRLAYTADMRYGHQAYEIEVPLDPAWLDRDDVDAVVRAFHALHLQMYGHADSKEPVEIISLHVKVSGETPKPLPVSLQPRVGSTSPASGQRMIRVRGQRYRASVFNRHQLMAGDAFEGPAVVDQEDTTVLVPLGFQVEVDGYGNLVIETDQSAARKGTAFAVSPASEIDVPLKGGVLLEILRNYFRAIVEDMARVVERTAFTTFVKETADFSTGLIATTGEYIAYPWRLGATAFLGMNMRTAIDFTAHYEPGDILIMNDPCTTGGLCTHLPDIHLLKPIFAGKEIVAYAYAFIHASDVGGAVPASVWPRAREVFQEGLRLRPAKLFKAGVLNEDLLNIIADNTRVPEMNWGDIKAMVAAVNTGERRLHEVIEKFGLEVVKESVVGLLDQVEERARVALATIPDGSYSFVDYMEDDMVSDVPVRLAVTMTARAGNVHLDFTGTDPQVSAALNLYTSGVPHPFLAQAILAYIFMVDNDIPRIGSVLRPVSMTLPTGTVVNPEFPAACGSRFGTSMRVTDTVLGVLAQAVPDRVPAASSGAISPVVGSLLDPVTGRRHVTVLEPMIGGSGALPDADGQSACDTTNGFLRNTPIESIEADIPIVMRRYDFIPDSGGVGRYRGGMAMRMEFQVFHPDAIVTARGQERFKIEPWGVAGGFCGTTGSTVVNPDTPRERDIGKIDVLPLSPGDIVRICAPAGGGHGEPLERDPQRVALDVRAGVVSSKAAQDAYGVVLGEGNVDEDATRARRALLLSARGPRAGFDFGPFRRELEQRWPLDISAECARLANSLPVPVRDYAKHVMFDTLGEIADGRVPTQSDLHTAWEGVRRRLSRALA